MNNSFLIERVKLNLEEPVDMTETFREREATLVKVLEAIREVRGTKGWSSLKELLFSPLVEELEKRLKTEAKQTNPDSGKLNRLAGELKWAEKYADLNKLEDTFRVELTNVRKQLYGKTEKPSR